MRPRAIKSSAQTLRRRLPPLFQLPVFLPRHLPRPQRSPPNAAHCSHQFASMSSAQTPLRRLRTGSSPWPWEQSSSPPWASTTPSTRCSPSDLPLEGFGVCTARRRLTPPLAPVPCMARGRKVSTISRFQAPREAVRSQGHHPRRLRLRRWASEARRTLSPCPDIRGQHPRAAHSRLPPS